MSNTTFSVGGNQYRTNKLNARKQWHLTRRLAPFVTSFSAIGGVLKSVEKTDDEALNRANAESAIAAIKPVLDALAAMSDEESDYILNMCLGAVDRDASGHWTPVWNNAAACPQFEDIDLPAMMLITVEVLKFNIGPFLQGLASTFGKP